MHTNTMYELDSREFLTSRKSVCFRDSTDQYYAVCWPLAGVRWSRCCV